VVTPSFIRATIGVPRLPARISLSRISPDTQSIVLSSGKWNSFGMTPTTCFILSETKNHLPITDGSRPNQALHS
jgi:hypothetical protein